jgi:hypothetical protein
VQDALAALPHPDKLNIHDVSNPGIKAALRQAKQSPDYAIALKTDLVARVAELVRQLRASGQRREAFKQSIQDVNDDQRTALILHPVQLLCQVPTHWSLTFLMMDRFLYLTPAINLLLDRPNPVALDRDDGLTCRETGILDDVCEVFSFFHSAQETLACEKTPTLPFVLPMYEDLLDAMKDLCRTYPNLVHAIYASIQKLEKYLLDSCGKHLHTLAMGKHIQLAFNL